MRNNDFVKKAYIIKTTNSILDYEKPIKHKNIKFIISKSIIAITLFLLAIVLVNFIGTFHEDKLSGINDENTGTATIKEDKPSNGILTEIPKVVEKSVFEYLLIRIPKNTLSSGITGKSVRKTVAGYYYQLKKYENVEFYVFDTSSSEVEITKILGYWNEYIGWSDMEYLQMLIDYNLLNNKYVK